MPFGFSGRSRGRGRGGRGHSAYSAGRHHGSSSCRGHRRDSMQLLIPALGDLITADPLGAEAQKKPALSSPPDFEAIPLRYSTPAAYLRAMQRHTEAEYYAAAVQGYCEASYAPDDSWRDFTMGSLGPDNRPCLWVHGVDFEADPWGKHLVEVRGRGTAMLVTSCKPGLGCEGPDRPPPDECSGHIFVRGIKTLGSSGQVRSLGYVGPHLLEYQSAEQLLLSPPAAGTAAALLLQMVAAPPAEHARTASSNATLASGGSACRLMADGAPQVPFNSTQGDAVCGLRHGLDVIHGPPGSGKSTTIWHLINSRVAPGRKCLVTCSRNQAVNAVVEKVASFGCLVFGSEARLGPLAREYTLKGRMKNDPELLWWGCMIRRVDKHQNALNGCAFQGWWSRQVGRVPGLRRLAAKEAEHRRVQDVNGCSGGKRSAAGLWLTAIKGAYEQSFQARLTPAEFRRLTLWTGLMRRAARDLSASVLPSATVVRRRAIVQGTRVFLCTIDSSTGMVQTLGEAMLGDKEVAAELAENVVDVDTCIVDEAGCVLETALPVLLRWMPANIILVGDHCQLQPFSRLQVQPGSPETHHSRSLLERSVEAGMKPWLLSTQYRMPERLSSLVSSLFYSGQLATAPELSLRPGLTVEPCRWVDVDSGSEVAHTGKGYHNPDEVDAVVVEAMSALDFGFKLIFVTTPYNKQRKELLEAMKRVPALAKAMEEERVQVLSVDACQGSEADCVILSLVRTSGVNSFLEDRRRMCVGLSRAKRECVVVGNLACFRSHGSAMWREITRHFRQVARQRSSSSSSRQEGVGEMLAAGLAGLSLRH